MAEIRKATDTGTKVSDWYLLLRRQFEKEVPDLAFWGWLAQQTLEQPWWTKGSIVGIGLEKVAKRDYLGKLYRSYKQTAQPTTQPTTQPSQGWDIEKYLAAVNASIDADTVDKKAYDKMSDKEKEGVYSSETAQAEKERIVGLAKTATDPTLLPGWGEYRRDWVYLNGIVKVQGKLFQMPDGSYYDIDANPVSGESAVQTMSDFYKTNQNVMSDYEKARLEFDIAEARRSTGQFQQGLAEQRRQFDITQQRLTAEKTNREQELQFELEREKQMAGWSAPSDWIRRWQLKNQPNPFTPVPMTLQHQAEAGLYEIEQARQQMLQFQGTARPDEFVETGQGWITPYEKNLQELTAKWLPVIQQQQAAASQQAEAMEEARATTGEYPTRPKVPTTPPAPAWLSQFAPGQAEGKPITGENIVTPSGQQWARTPWSVREGVRGYANWAGGKPYEEVIEEMESMLPRSPRGVANRRWIPTRQMA